MLNKKAHGASVGTGRKTTAGSQLSSPNCTRNHNHLSSPPTGDLGQLLDQAQNFLDHCEAEAAYHCDQAIRHTANAALHRAILRRLQALVPTGQEVQNG